jgi:hypothetical protein
MPHTMSFVEYSYILWIELKSMNMCFSLQSPPFRTQIPQIFPAPLESSILV